jgi:hypothetical protein
LHEVETEQPADAVRGCRMKVGGQVGKLVCEPEAARIPVREHRIEQANQVVLGMPAPAVGGQASLVLALLGVLAVSAAAFLA